MTKWWSDTIKKNKIITIFNFIWCYLIRTLQIWFCPKCRVLGSLCAVSSPDSALSSLPSSLLVLSTKDNDSEKKVAVISDDDNLLFCGPIFKRGSQSRKISTSSTLSSTSASTNRNRCQIFLPTKPPSPKLPSRTIFQTPSLQHLLALPTTSSRLWDRFSRHEWLNIGGRVSPYSFFGK